MLEITPSDSRADSYLLTAVKLDVDDVVYVMLLRIYDNGFLTSAGFSKSVFVEENIVSPDEVLCLYNTIAGDWLPLDWTENNSACFIPAVFYQEFLGGQLEEGRDFYRGIITAIDFDTIYKYIRSDNPALTDEPVFTSNRGETFAFVAI